jgi:L-ribulose-5-phosphate 4-epimerase
MEKLYTGTNFLTEFRKRETIRNSITISIKYWSAFLAENDCAPAIAGGYGGNLSCRTQEGFFITAAGANLAELQDEQITHVRSFNLQMNKVIVDGVCLPSSESLLHGAIYEARPEINAIFHGHHSVSLSQSKALKIKVTANEAPYGSKELINEVLRILSDENFVIMKNHGFLSMGKTTDEAGEMVRKVRGLLRSGDG